MKVIILGSNGNLGTQLRRVFSERHDVLSLDTNNSDMFDLERLEKIITDYQPEIIINAVAYNNVDECEISPEARSIADSLNIILPKFLAELCLKNNYLLVSYSSDYVFGKETRDFPYSEWDNPNPVNYYGLSKMKGEEYVIKLGLLGLKHYLIRTSKLFGPQGSGSFTKKSFFDIMIEVSKKQAEIKVVDEEISSFTYTPDLASYTNYLVSQNYPYGIYHLVNKGQATWAQATETLFKFLKIAIKIVPVSGESFSRPAKRPNYSLLDNTKMMPLPYWKQSLEIYLKKYYL